MHVARHLTCCLSPHTLLVTTHMACLYRPDNIVWENLEVPKVTHWVRRQLTSVVSLIVLAVSFAAVAKLADLKTSYAEKVCCTAGIALLTAGATATDADVHADLNSKSHRTLDIGVHNRRLYFKCLCWGIACARVQCAKLRDGQQIRRVTRISLCLCTRACDRMLTRNAHVHDDSLLAA